MSFRALDQMFRPEHGQAEPVVIYGAGKGGLLVLREIRDNPALGWRVAAFLDDDRHKHGTRVDGVPVEGGLEALRDTVAAMRANSVVVSTPQLDGERLAAVLDVCRQLGVKVVLARLRFDSLE